MSLSESEESQGGGLGRVADFMCQDQGGQKGESSEENLHCYSVGILILGEKIIRFGHGNIYIGRKDI